jgi:hypothetical protein
VLLIGDDWAEARYDIEIEDEAGCVLARRRLPEGLAGITVLHALVAEHLDPASRTGTTSPSAYSSTRAMAYWTSRQRHRMRPLP